MRVGEICHDLDGIMHSPDHVNVLPAGGLKDAQRHFSVEQKTAIARLPVTAMGLALAVFLRSRDILHLVVNHYEHSGGRRIRDPLLPPYLFLAMGEECGYWRYP